MISNFHYQKTVDQLRTRMNEIKRSYKRAFYYSFFGGLAFFVLQLIYNGILLVAQSRAWMLEHFDTEMLLHSGEIAEKFKVFLPNIILLTASILCAVLGFVCFNMKYRVVKVIFFILELVFTVSFILLLIMGFDFTSFICATIFSVGLIALTIDCFIKDADEERLSKIEGYPAFEPLVMENMDPEPEARETLRFPDKGEEGYKKLVDERDDIYLESNPHSEMAKIRAQEMEEKRDMDISNWLDDMLGTGEDK